MIEMKSVQKVANGYGSKRPSSVFQNPLYNKTAQVQKKPAKKRHSVSSDTLEYKSQFRMKTLSDIVNNDDWVDDNKSPHCLLCRAPFHSRCNWHCRSGRHHCRYCGILACSECTKYTLHGARCCKNCQTFCSTDTRANESQSLSMEQRNRNVAATLFREKFIIAPDTRLWEAWDLLLFFLISYQCIIVPLQISVFRLEENDADNAAWEALDIAVAIILVIDVFLRTRVTYYDVMSHTYCRSSVDIFKRYLHGFFWLDMLSAIPFDIFVGNETDKVSAKAFKLVRLLRIPGLMRNIRLLMDKVLAAKVYKTIAPALELFLYFFLFAHIAGCVFIWCALDVDKETNSVNVMGWIRDRNLQDEDPSMLYIRSVYWSVMTITTVGYGDIVPSSRIGHVWAMVTMVVGNVLSAFIFGTLAAGLKELIDAQNECNNKMSAVEAYMQQCHVPKQMQDEVISYYTTKWKLYGTWCPEKTVVDDLPLSLKSKIDKFRHRPMFQSSPIILLQPRNAQNFLIETMAKYLKSVLIMPGQTVYNYGEVCDSIYFIRNGVVDRISGRTKEKLGSTLLTSEYFGDELIPMDDSLKSVFTLRIAKMSEFDAQICYQGSNRRMCTMLTTSVSELESMSYEDLENVRRESPETSEMMSFIATSRRVLIVDDNLRFEDQDITKEALAFMRQKQGKNERNTI